MFDQLTWSLGMFTQSACVLFAIGYCLRNSTLAKTWIYVSDSTPPDSRTYKQLWPAIGLVLLYSIELGFLHWADGGHDSTALDWAVVILLLGGLVVHPSVTAVATIPALVVRASMVFSYSADPDTKSSFESHGLWLTDSRFWTEEQWIWGDPGVLLLLTCSVLAIASHTLWRLWLRREYPLWIGIPIALISQAVYVLSANLQWDRSSALRYLQNEAAPAAISLAVVVTALVILLRALGSARDKHRIQKAELASAQNQLKFLNAQINPHFLNNSLNAVSAISMTQPEQTRELVDNLALHFRSQCDVTSSLVRFKDEWTLVRCYIDIEQVRMGERLSMQEQIDPACMDALLPRLVIQPLVENAIQHGIQTNRKCGLLTLTANMRDTRLIVTVEDNGPGQMKTLTSAEYGTGLSNVYSRLQHFYANTASLKIESQWGNGTKAILDIPAEVEEPA